MARALLIVEGGNLEPRFFTRMAGLYGMNVEIVSLRANIYLLYRKLKEYGFDYDVRIALKELLQDKVPTGLLDQAFAYTYLVFDCDAHHSGIPRKGEPPKPIGEIVRENYRRLREMIDYFTEETDPERGRLYVNYPMMESYRDCNSWDDDAFRCRSVRYEDLSHYKQSVGTMRMSNFRIDELTGDCLDRILRLQLRKYNWLTANVWECPASEVYQRGERFCQRRVLDCQMSLSHPIMSVVNTSVFLPIDYYGSEEWYRRHLINESHGG